MLRIYTQISLPNFGAQKFYRVAQPLQCLQEMELSDNFIDFGDHLQDHNRPAAEALSGIHFFHQNYHPSVQKAVEHYCGEPAKWVPTREGPLEWDAPPTLVMDTDDDFFNAMPTHAPTFRAFGTKTMDGTPMKAGQGIGERDEETGEEKVVWMDGQGGFSLEENKARIAQWRTNLALSGLVICSTPAVEKAVRREVPNANTLVIPNTVNFKDYPEVRFAEDDKVRILWQGASGHELCFLEIADALRRTLDKYPNAELIVWGPQPAEILEKLGTERVTFLPWCAYWEHKLRLNSLGHDINLCPLYDHPFNLGRSALKWYESSACSKPAATLAKRLGAFADEIEDGKTGFLFSDEAEFEEKLAKLIEDRSLRVEMAAQAKAWVAENRDPHKWAVVLGRELKKIREIRKSLWKAPAPLEVPQNVSPE